ncbi:MAG: helix-turn-helix domain-containing protein [Ruminococcaceae bacterium]|nr:helix-turn-helix domain-containing protein [Oscillospiraceae bacterium]
MFFDRLKKLCDERGISAYKACTDIGLNRAAVAKWKNGSIPSGSTAAKLADYFGVTTDYLLGKENKKAPTVSGERDILDDVDVAFYGDFKELNEDEKETVRDMVRLMRQRKEKRSQ